jgi:hypothetical protein
VAGYKCCIAVLGANVALLGYTVQECAGRCHAAWWWPVWELYHRNCCLAHSNNFGSDVITILCNSLSSSRLQRSFSPTGMVLRCAGSLASGYVWRFVSHDGG